MGILRSWEKHLYLNIPYQLQPARPFYVPFQFQQRHR
nr:MAG TPA: hypothetical protein [Caudoviricetes sp.]